MEEWKECKLGDICNISSSKRIFAEEYVSSGIPFYRGKEIIEKHNKNTVSSELFITHERFAEIKSKFPVPQIDDILLTSVGTLGIPWLVNESNFYFKDGNLTWFRSNTEKVNPKFLYYWFESNYAKNQIDSMCIGSTQKALTIDTLSKFSINLPPLPTQQKIAAILSSLDDKIELNNKINTNLEQQAGALFKNWFVDFEPFDGKMPEGWKEIPLEELCTVVTKGTTPTTLGKKFTDSGINFIKGESILDNHTFDLQKISHIDDETNLMLKRSIIQSNDILFTIAGTLGRFAIIDETLTPANTNQAVGIIRANPKIISPYYLYSFFIGNWHNDYYTKRIQQAVQANLSLGTIKSLPIIILDSQNLNKYTNLIEPLFRQMKQLENENKALSNFRDTLLPKLMNGEIEV